MYKEEEVIPLTQEQINNTLQFFEILLRPSIAKYKRQTEEIRRIKEAAKNGNK